VIQLSYPLPNIPSAGDTFNMSQGCLRTQAACSAYGNLPRFKGFPYVPVPPLQIQIDRGGALQRKHGGWPFEMYLTEHRSAVGQNKRTVER